MATDIYPSIMGPHALAVMSARTKALKAYGIDPHALMLNQEKRLPVTVEEKTKKLAKISKATRALAIESDHDVLVV